MIGLRMMPGVAADGTPQARWVSPFDIDGDGHIDIKDLYAWRQYFATVVARVQGIDFTWYSPVALDTESSQIISDYLTWQIARAKQIAPRPDMQARFAATTQPAGAAATQGQVAALDQKIDAYARQAIATLASLPAPASAPPAACPPCDCPACPTCPACEDCDPAITPRWPEVTISFSPLIKEYGEGPTAIRVTFGAGVTEEQSQIVMRRMRQAMEAIVP